MTTPDDSASTPTSARREVRVERTSTGNYLATNADGVQVAVGMAPEHFSPVELLLAAVGACSAIDVDVVTARRAEPKTFEVVAGGEKFFDETGGARLRDVSVDFSILFGDDEAGRQAAGLVERLVRLSHDRDCTVSRTVEHETPVVMRVTEPER
ncbi:OsmC family protein [Luteococcus sp. Sow4_B9]|uniref:OsmC family protein n=1 Tax=Luteococcus sp. Sow4_B9 TaxID=3438792 RepID=UPI003F9E51C7